MTDKGQKLHPWGIHWDGESPDEPDKYNVSSPIVRWSKSGICSRPASEPRHVDSLYVDEVSIPSPGLHTLAVSGPVHPVVELPPHESSSFLA